MPPWKWMAVKFMPPATCALVCSPRPKISDPIPDIYRFHHFSAGSGAVFRYTVAVISEVSVGQIVQTEMTVLVTPDMANFSGNMHGGELLKLLDKVAYTRSEEHTSELQSRENLVCRLLLEKTETSIQ